MTRFSAPICAALIAIATGMPATAPAQESYPSKPIRVISPVPPGSGTDIALRAAGQELLPRMGQPWVVEVRTGASMVIAAEACARSAPDGYTLCFVSSTTMSSNPHTFLKLPYDPEKDFKPVTHLYYLITGLIATASLAANTVKELQGLATAKPGSLNFGTLGPGSSPDVFRQWLSERWKTDIVGIHYKGGPQIVTALVAGEIHLSHIGLGSAGGQLGAGKVKVLAVDTSKRYRVLPDVPTLAEAQLAGSPSRGWWGLAVPAGTPDAIVTRLNAELVRLFREPKFSEFVESQFLEPAVGTPEAFASFMKADRERVAQLVKTFNIPRQ